jgi:hypothetical protein
VKQLCGTGSTCTFKDWLFPAGKGQLCGSQLCTFASAAAAARAALDLLASELTDQGLASLGALQQLQQLKLYQAAVSVDALQQFAGEPAGRGLTCLVLYGLGMLTQLQCLGECCLIAAAAAVTTAAWFGV